MTVGRGQGQPSSQDSEYISTRALGEPFGWDTEEMTRWGARTRVAAVTMLSMAGLAAIAFDPRPENGIQVAASASQPEKAPLRVTAETKLPGAPAGIAIGDGSVWVTTYDQVVRLDVGTAEIRDQIGPYGDRVVFVGHGIVVADDRVWVASPTTVDGHDHGDYQGAVVRIDPSTGNVDGELRDEDDSPSAITALEDRVWVAGWSETFKLVKRKADGYERMITLGQPVSGLASGHGALWTVSPSEGLVLRIDPDSGEATRFDLGGPRENLRVAAVGADGIWAADDESVIEFDPLTGAVTRRSRSVAFKTPPSQTGRSGFTGKTVSWPSTRAAEKSPADCRSLAGISAKSRRGTVKPGSPTMSARLYAASNAVNHSRHYRRFQVRSVRTLPGAGAGAS